MDIQSTLASLQLQVGLLELKMIVLHCIIAYWLNMWQDQNNTNRTLQTLEELLEQVLAINDSLEVQSDTEETELVISIDMSSGCEKEVVAAAINIGISFTAIDYINEVRMHSLL